jgi:hypothetical protein
MENTILTKEMWHPSFYDDFKDDRIGESEPYNLPGGIEKSDRPSLIPVISIPARYGMWSTEKSLAGGICIRPWRLRPDQKSKR